MDITEQELAMLEAVATEDEWNEACDKIKKARNGTYPPDWWTRVRLSGMMGRIVKRFDGVTEPKIIPIK